jgi:hypothetical protein
VEVPAGMEDDRFNLMGNRPLLRAKDIPRNVESGWKMLNGFFHRNCGGCILEHPDEPLVWACSMCDKVTDSPSLHFSAVVKH